MFQQSDFFQPPQVPCCLAELGRQERPDQVPGDGRTHRSATHANDVEVIIFNSLPGGESVVDQSSSNSRNLVGANRHADATAANRDAAIYLPVGNSLSQRDHKLQIVVVWILSASSEVVNLVPCAFEMRD